MSHDGSRVLKPKIHHHRSPTIDFFGARFHSLDIPFFQGRKVEEAKGCVVQ